MINQSNKQTESENDPICAMLGELKRVEAPRDFDFHVRARIAKGRPSEKSASWLPTSIRYAVPLSLVLAAGGYVGFKAMYSAGDASVPLVSYAPVEISRPPEPLVVAPALSRDVQPDAPASAARVKELENSRRVTKTAEKTLVPSKSKSDKPGGGSYVAAGTAAKTITQPDLDANAPPPVKKVFVSVGAYLATIGIAATSSGAGGRIISVSGAAAGAGLKAGDVIESVNVQTGTVRVIRDGKSVVVTLR